MAMTTRHPVTIDGKKRCTRCKREQPVEEFYVVKSHGRSWRQAQCRACGKEVAVAWAKRNPEKKAASDRRQSRKASKQRANRLATYNLTEAGLLAMEAAQQNICPICKRFVSDDERGMCVDHDHATGRVRGLLCIQCNSGLGMFKDSPRTLVRAARYLLCA